MSLLLLFSGGTATVSPPVVFNPDKVTTSFYLMATVEDTMRLSTEIEAEAQIMTTKRSPKER